MQLTPWLAEFFIKIVTNIITECLPMPCLIFKSSLVFLTTLSSFYRWEKWGSERRRDLFQVTLGEGESWVCSLDPLFSRFQLGLAWLFTLPWMLLCLPALGESCFLFSFSSAQGKLEAFSDYPVPKVAHISPPTHSLTLHFMYCIEVTTTENVICLFLYCPHPPW